MAPTRAAPSLGLVLGACALLHAVAFDYGVVSDDEAIHATEARVMMDGGVIYRDLAEHRPPGIPTTYAWVFSAVGDAYGRGMAAVHALGIVVATLTSLAIWAIGRRVLLAKTGAPERRPDPATVGALLYTFLSVAKVPYDGIAVNGELLMNLPIALAVLAALEATRDPAPIGRRLALDLAVGFLSAAATLYKYQAGLVLVALLVLELERPKTAPLRIVLWALGFLMPMAAVALFFQAHGALAEARFWGLDFNRHYLAEGPPLLWSLERLGAQLAGVVLPAIVLYGAAGFTILRVVRRDPRAKADLPDHRWFVTTWAVLSVLAVGLGGRFFGHYFLQAELPLAILAAAPATRLLERAPRLFAVLVAGPALFFACGSLVPPGHPGAWLDSPQPDYEGIGRAVQRVSKPDDSMWVWGNAPEIYFTARRRPGVRFTFCNYLTGLSPATPSEYDASVDPGKNVVPEAMGLAIRDLDERRPKWILDTAAAGLKAYGKFPIANYPVLASYLAAHYLRDGDADGVPLYRRTDAD
jgi:hypothetical protein